MIVYIIKELIVVNDNKSFSEVITDYVSMILELFFGGLTIILLSIIVLYLVYVFVKNTIFRNKKKTPSNNEKILIQGVHGSGKTYKLLFDENFINDKKIQSNCNRTENSPLIHRIYNVDNLEYEFIMEQKRLKKNSRLSNKYKNVAYVSCTGLTVDEIYINILRACITKSFFGWISNFITNIKSINFLQTTIDFTFSSKHLCYNHHITTIVIDDYDRLSSSDFFQDTNKFLGLLKNLEVYYDFILLYATKSESKDKYVQENIATCQLNNSNISKWSLNGLSFYKTSDNDMIFNELILKSNFNRIINVKLDLQVIYTIIKNMLHTDFLFYAENLSNNLSKKLLYNLELDIRTLRKIISDFNLEAVTIKEKNLEYYKIIGFDLQTVDHYFNNNLHNRLVKRSIDVYTLESCVTSFIFDYYHTKIEGTNPAYNQVLLDHEDIRVDTFSTKFLVENVKNNPEFSNNLLEFFNKIMSAEEIENVNKMYKELAKKYDM